MQNPELDPIRQLAASTALLRAEVAALRALVMKMNPALEIDGEPVKKWLGRVRTLCIERELGHLADENAAMASYVKQMLDEAKKKRDESDEV